MGSGTRKEAHEQKPVSKIAHGISP